MDEVCRHCGEPIMKFHFTEGDEWWHATVTRRDTYRHCHGDPSAPIAEP